MSLRIRRYFVARPFAAGVIATLCILTAGASLTAAATNFHRYITVAYSANTSGPVVEGINSGSGIGVEGVTDVGSPSGAIALNGFGTSTTNASVGVNGSVNGPGSTALIGNANSTTGLASIGLEGFSQNGEGVFAQSLSASFPSLRSIDGSAFFDVRLSDAPNGNGMSALLNSDTGGFAVVGNDTVSASSANSGVFGNTTSGFYGVEGEASGNAFAGVFGFGNASGINGVDGSSIDSSGVHGLSTSGNGVFGSSSNNDGTDGFTTNPSATQAARSGVFGLDNSSDGGSGNLGVTGASTNGVGAQGVTTNGIAGVFGSSTNVNGVWGSGGNFGVVGQCAGGAPAGEFVGTPDGSSINFTVDCTGTPSAIVKTRSNLYARTSVSTSTIPVLEDYGQGQLVNGVASVRLDAAYADAITNRGPYLVFLTPDGDTNGLYVASKTTQGFVVREVRAGHSNLTFDYRIVSQPASQVGHRMTLTSRPLVMPGSHHFAPASAIIAQHLAEIRARSMVIARKQMKLRSAHLRSHLPLPMNIYEPRMGADGRLHSTLKVIKTKPQ